jgi:hypothetical protein
MVKRWKDESRYAEHDVRVAIEELTVGLKRGRHHLVYETALGGISLRAQEAQVVP